MFEAPDPTSEDGKGQHGCIQGAERAVDAVRYTACHPKQCETAILLLVLLFQMLPLLLLRYS